MDHIHSHFYAEICDSHSIEDIDVGLLSWYIMWTPIWVDSNVSDKHTASIFRAEVGDSMFLQNVGILM
jgi:hypothetical protein